MISRRPTQTREWPWGWWPAWPAARPSAPPRPPGPDPSAAASFQPTLTSLWLLCLAIGGVGLITPYARPLLIEEAPNPMPVQTAPLQVQLESHPNPASPGHRERTSDPASVPPLPQPVAAPLLPTVATMDLPPLPDAPSLPAPNALATAVALPVLNEPIATEPEGSARATRPAVSHGAGSGFGSAGSAQTLVLGKGEGRQPAPPYPWEARRQGQEGTVRIRLCVGPDGRVLWAEALESCPWPLLREAALRTVRRAWRFRPGEVRLYEVEIRFELARAVTAGRA